MTQSKDYLVSRLISLKERPHMNGSAENVLYSAKLLVHIILRIQNGEDWEIGQTSRWWNENQELKNLANRPYFSAKIEIEGELYSLVLEMMEKVWVEISQKYIPDKIIAHEIENLFNNKALNFIPDAKSLELALYNSFLTCNLRQASHIREMYISSLKLYQPNLRSYNSYKELSDEYQVIDPNNDYLYSDVVKVLGQILKRLP